MAVAAALLGCPDRTVAPFPTDYAGVGVELTARNGGISVVRVIPGGPADGAGVAAGARVLEVAGRPTSGMPLVQVVEALRGPAGSAVTLTLRDEGEPYRVTIHRGRVVRAGGDGGAYQGGAVGSR